jgi:hypothetical protein
MITFLHLFFLQNNTKPWFMCLKETIQSSEMDSFEIIQIREV